MSVIESKDFAARLDRLWRSVYPKGQGRPYTYDEVARAITADGVPITGAYLQQLRTGKRTDPRRSYVAAISKFFGVPVEYFFDANVANDISRQITELAEIRDAVTRAEASQLSVPTAIALRAQGLSPKSIEAIANLMDQARRLEGLPSVEEPSPRTVPEDG